MPPETPAPTCVQCSEAKTLGRMEGTLNAIRTQTEKINGSIVTLFERSGSHRVSLNVHQGRIEALEGESKDKKDEASDWRKFGMGFLKGVLLLVAAYGINKVFN